MVQMIPEFEMWYSHGRDSLTLNFSEHWVYHALILFVRTRWLMMDLFYPTGAFLPEQYSNFKFNHSLGYQIFIYLIN